MRCLPSKREMGWLVIALRWWFGLVSLAMGIVGVVWAPIAAEGGFFLFVGGATVAYVGWLTLPRRPHLRLPAMRKGG